MDQRSYSPIRLPPGHRRISLSKLQAPEFCNPQMPSASIPSFPVSAFLSLVNGGTTSIYAGPAHFDQEVVELFEVSVKPAAKRARRS